MMRIYDFGAINITSLEYEVQRQMNFNMKASSS